MTKMITHYKVVTSIQSLSCSLLSRYLIHHIAGFSLGNTKLYLHLLLYLDTDMAQLVDIDMTQVVEIRPREIHGTIYYIQPILI